MVWMMLSASALSRDIGDDWILLPLFIGVAVATCLTPYRKSLVQWINGIRGRDWATVSAVIDVVSVAPDIAQSEYGEHVVGYLATLTYFYRTPELQTGEYSRRFSTESEAQEWAALYKGRSVMVHVNPRDNADSVLRAEDL